MATSNKKMIRKTIQVQTTELNSVLRLGHQVNKLKNDLKKADADKALVLAKDKILDSPNTKKTFKKTVAKRVDFGPDEKLYNKLTSLDISNVDKKVLAKRTNLHSGKRDPEPCLSDYHEPFHGEAVPMTSDSKEFKAQIAEKFYKQDPEWRKKYLANRTRFQDNFKR